jgi:hypothetical protein
VSKNPDKRSSSTRGPKIIKPIVAFFSILFLFVGSNVVILSSYAEPQGELSPQLQQKLQQQQGLTSNATASPSPQLQQQALSSNMTTSPSPQLQQQQAPSITFQQGPDTGGEPCDGAYFVGPGGVTKCM